MSGGEIRTARQARTVLGLAEGAGLEEVRRAYRAAVREAHPDHGGDADRLRRVIEAHDLLQELHKARLHLARAAIHSAPETTPAEPPPPPVWPLEITVTQAVRGGRKSVRLPDGRRGALKLPEGLRQGDVVRLKSRSAALLFKIAYADEALEVRGDDVWMSVPVAPDLLERGGSLAVEAPTGTKSVSVAPGSVTLRLSGQGLPARGQRPQGHLYVRLVADPAQAKARACDLLRRFTAAWAA